MEELCEILTQHVQVGLYREGTSNRYWVAPESTKIRRSKGYMPPSMYKYVPIIDELEHRWRPNFDDYLPEELIDRGAISEILTEDCDVDEQIQQSQITEYPELFHKNVYIVAGILVNANRERLEPVEVEDFSRYIPSDRLFKAYVESKVEKHRRTVEETVELFIFSRLESPLSETDELVECLKNLESAATESALMKKDGRDVLGLRFDSVVDTQTLEEATDDTRFKVYQDGCDVYIYDEFDREVLEEKLP